MTLKTVLIYTTSRCPYCQRAKQFLSEKGVPFVERNLDGQTDELTALRKKTGLRTVPQIFIDDELVGGCDDLLSLEKQGVLDQRLGLTQINQPLIRV